VLDEEKLREAAIHGTAFDDAEGGVIFSAVGLGGQPIGGLATPRGKLSDTLLQSAVNLIAISLEGERSRGDALRAETLRQSGELKATILDAIAHEFQTPLTAIRASTSALLSGTQSRELIEIIDEETGRLSDLVRDAVQMARIETGRVKLEAAPVHPEALVNNVLTRLHPMFESHPVDLHFDCGLTTIRVDSELMELAVRQILSNAGKYTPPGTQIHVRARVDGNQFEISIADEGPGIPVADRAHIFDRFFRGDGLRHQVSGTGMGLAIARDIVRAHGGDLRLAASDKGAAFHLTLPLNGDRS
jgi:two-component system sensor histidine kinase KdpD